MKLTILCCTFQYNISLWCRYFHWNWGNVVPFKYYRLEIVNFKIVEVMLRNKFALIPLLQMFIGLPANIHLFIVNNRNTRKRCGICSKLTIKYQSNVNNVLLLMFLLLTSKNFTPLSRVSIVDFEQVNISCAVCMNQ